MIVLGILQRITQKVLWNCSKLFIRVCFCSNNKPISGVTAKAGFYSLFPSASVWLGWLGLFCFTMRTSSPGFECLPLAVTVIFFTSDFRRKGGWGGRGSPNRWSLPVRAGWGGGLRNAVCVLFPLIWSKRAPLCLFVRLFHLHIKRGRGCPKKKKKNSQCANAMSKKKYVELLKHLKQKATKIRAVVLKLRCYNLCSRGLFQPSTFNSPKCSALTHLFCMSCIVAYWQRKRSFWNIHFRSFSKILVSKNVFNL